MDFSVGSWLFLMVLSGCEVRIATEVGNSSDQVVDGQVFICIGFYFRYFGLKF